MLKIRDLKKSYDDREIFHDIDLDIEDGDVVGIIGASGSGKSQLLRCIIRLDEIDNGQIFLNDMEVTSPDSDIDEVHKRIGMVFQNFGLFSHMSIIENVMSGMVHINHMDTKEAFGKAMKLLKDVGLSDKAYAYPDILSGGQKQRAAIARTMSLDPEILLLDEPTSSLDPIMKGEVEAVIRMLAKDGHTMILVTHEMELIRSVCNKVVFLNNGIVWEQGTPSDILDNAQKPETRRFVRALRILEFDINSEENDFLGMQTDLLQFAYRNGISRNMTNRMLAILEEFEQMVIIQPKESNVMHMTFEYNKHEEVISGEILFSGPPFDLDDPMYVFSWPIITLRATSINTQPTNEAPYVNRTTLTICER